MGSWLQTIIIIVCLLATTASFVWMAIRLSSAPKKANNQDFSTDVEKNIDHIFNNEFREELKNRGRLHFEKIIGENAMFLQQDLRLTTSQVNDYMKQEITKTLREAFTKYQESIKDAENLALGSIQKTQDTVERQRDIMSQQMQLEIDKEKARLTELFAKRMAEIVNHYVLTAIGNQISLDDQIEFIMAELERNKNDIIEDIKQGA